MDKETQIEVEKNGQKLLNRIERERERYLARIKHHYNQRKKNLHYSPGKSPTMMMIPHAWKNQS